MNILKSTLESFKENELLRTHKVKINGGYPVDFSPADEFAPYDEEVDENGDPIDPTNPAGGGGSGPSGTGGNAATLGNNGASTVVVVPGK